MEMTIELIDVPAEISVFGYRNGDQVEAYSCPIRRPGCVHFLHDWHGTKLQMIMPKGTYKFIINQADRPQNPTK